MGGEWGKVEENGELWEIAKNTLWEMYQKCVKLVGNRRKNRKKLGQISLFFTVPFSPFFHSLATFPSSSFDELLLPLALHLEERLAVSQSVS